MRQGRFPYKNAKVHSSQRNLARIDVKKCYPSITNTMAYRVLRSLGFGPEPARLLTRLCTRSGHLPQGAPTSDMIANLYLRPLDETATRVAAELGLRNSRCMDDVAVSGRSTREAMEPVIAKLRSMGLAVRHKKTSNAGPGKAHNLTGFGVNGSAPKVSREKVQQIRTAVYELVQAYGVGDPVVERVRSVQGSLAYLRPTNPGLVARLERQISEAEIPFLEIAKSPVVQRRELNPCPKGPTR